MGLPRRSGLLLHITSLPGGRYTGDLGSSAYAFADFLSRAGQAWWQTLPLNPIGKGNSPYSSIASFASEPLLISPELLVENGLLESQNMDETPPVSTDWYSSFGASRLLRKTLLGQAYQSFSEHRPESIVKSFADFRAREEGWLADYCLFAALSEHLKTSDWTSWPEGLAKHDAEAVQSATNDLEEQIEYLAFEQYLFDEQWRALKRHCQSQGVGIIGDIPMFVSHESADVWAHQRAFLLNDDGLPEYVAGAPPDAFAHDGQTWGNALYNWAYHESTDFAWWKKRIARQLDLFDAVRLDHFIGFRRYWRIPRGAQSARDGRWIPAPGEELFDELARIHGELPLIAEDLGTVTQEVWDLRDRYNLPGMKVMQFAFHEEEPPVTHRPHNYPPSSVAYTGTHDSETTLGWYRALRHREDHGDAAAVRELRKIHTYFGTTDEAKIVDAAIRTLSTSPANTVIIPVQDVLNLDGSHRMNTPGTSENNWTWRLKDGELDQRVADRLRELAEVTERC